MKVHTAARWAFDTEDDSKGKVYWINFYNGVEHTSFDRFERAIEWLYEQEGDFWACNLEYDLINTFNALLDKMCVLTYAGFGLLKASIAGRKVRFLNTVRHWPMSVEEMGERLGYPKLPFEPTNLKYCQRDTEITWRFVGEMLGRYEALGMEKIGATLPSTAMSFYIKRFCQVNFERGPNLQDWHRLARARYGGRCEVFHTAPVESPVHEYDIVSSYPAAMLSRRFPNLDTCNLSPGTPDFSRAGIAFCRVKSPDQEFPVLPWKDPESGKLLFPIGRFNGTWTYPEIRLALSRGYTVEAIHDCIEYEEMDSPFHDYIAFLHKMRSEVKERDPLMGYTLKIAMNSTFGKFGEEGDLTIISKGKKHVMSQIPRHSNMIWAAYILAYGRINLYEYMRQASEKGTLLYCDTDSVFVRSRKPPFGDGETGLGQLAFKGSYHYSHFKLPKLYRLDDHYKAKGVPLDKRSPDNDRLKREFFYEGVAEFMKPYRFLESKKLREIPNLWRECTKQVNAVYDKRQMLGQGKTWPNVVNSV